MEWTADRGLSSLPADPAILILYLEHLVQEGRAKTTIRTAASAVSAAHRAAGFRGGGNPAAHELDFTQNPGKVMDDITFVRSHWWLVSEGFSLSTANSDVQKLPATLYHRIADSLAYAA